MFSTDFIFRQQENLVDNQECLAGFRPLCNKILLPCLPNLRGPLRRMGCAQFIAGDELLSFAFARLLLETINSSKNASAQKKTVCLFCLFFSSFQDFFSFVYPKLHLS